MDDGSILKRIAELADEERELEESHIGEPLSADGLERLALIELQLDQCWDLLRQRRARRSAGRDPDEAIERPEMVVERYEQ